MTDPVKPAAPAPHNAVLPSDIDANGNVTIWDSGPTDDSPEAKAWHEENDAPVPLVMHNSDASHALSVEPDRYALEPEGMDAEIEAEVKKLQEARKAAKKAAEDREAAIELAADRKNAVATVMASKAAKAAAEKAEKPKKAPAKAAAEDHTYPAPKAKDK